MRLNSANSKKNKFVNMWFVKKYWTFTSTKNCYFLCIYKVYLISAEGYKNGGVSVLRVQKAGEIWPSMKDVGQLWVLKTYLI